MKQSVQVKKIMGRPTKYYPAIVDKIELYFQQCGREQTALPTVEGLADYLDITSETVKIWARKFPDFSLSIKKLFDKQKTQLMNDGMYGGKEVNAAMAIFLLKCNYGMNDGSQVQVNIQVKPILGGETVVYSHDSNESDTPTTETH
jgi:hypothetical protein